MQTKKKANGRNASREHASPRVSRPAKKVSENVHVSEKKVTELITSSVRKQKSEQITVDILSKKNGEAIAATNSNNRYHLVNNETSGACLGYDSFNEASMDYKGCNEENSPPVLETIFSPAFHSSKVAGGEGASGVDFVKFFRSGDRKFHEESGMEYSQIDMLDGQVTEETSESNFGDSEGANLSSEVSAIYLAMKNSKLECVDEHTQESMSTDACVEEDEYEEFDDFDPYLFIKNLPELSSVVPTFRPMLLPKQTRSCPPATLVLDLDETLVHSMLKPCDDADFSFPINFNLQEYRVYVRCRPHLKDFLERVSSLLRSLYSLLVKGNYLKDLSVLGRDLAHVIIVDNSPQAFGFQVDNGVPIDSWFDDRSDQELLLLLPFLESLVGVEDVRPLIAKKFNLREKIAAADYPLNSNRGDPF